MVSRVTAFTMPNHQVEYLSVVDPQDSIGGKEESKEDMCLEKKIQILLPKLDQTLKARAADVEDQIKKIRELRLQTETLHKASIALNGGYDQHLQSAIGGMGQQIDILTREDNANRDKKNAMLAQMEKQMITFIAKFDKDSPEMQGFV